MFHTASMLASYSSTGRTPDNGPMTALLALIVIAVVVTITMKIFQAVVVAAFVAFGVICFALMGGSIGILATLAQHLNQ